MHGKRFYLIWYLPFTNAYLLRYNKVWLRNMLLEDEQGSPSRIPLSEVGGNPSEQRRAAGMCGHGECHHEKQLY